jgi:methionyl-tRNA formyltransferase
VADAARSLAVPLVEVESVRSERGREALERTGPDVLAVVAYGEILSPDVLDAAPLGAVNVHFSLLPALRGASPVQHALLRGLAETGVTTMRLDEGLDTGPVFRQVRETIHPFDDAGSLGERLAELGGRLLVSTLDGIANGSLEPIPQDETGISWAPKLSPADRHIRWSDPGASIVDRIRALSPDPAASTSFRGRGLKVFRAELADPRSDLEPPGAPVPGTVLAAPGTGLVVAAGETPVRLLELGPAGSRRMHADAFVNGFHPEPGEQLG